MFEKKEEQEPKSLEEFQQKLEALMKEYGVVLVPYVSTVPTAHNSFELKADIRVVRNPND
jgi:hypothetical protein